MTRTRWQVRRPRGAAEVLSALVVALAVVVLAIRMAAATAARTRGRS
ncbi:hypothetical protein [Streptomyces sp. NPDC002779]